MKKNLKEYLNKSVVEATWMEIQSDMDDGGEKTYSCETLHRRMNNKTLRKIVLNSLLVLLVIGALLGSSITIYGFSIPEYKRELYERRDELAENGCIEIVSLREEYVKQYAFSDGSFEAVIYPFPIHAMNEQGKWEDLYDWTVPSSVGQQAVFVDVTDGQSLNDYGFCDTMVDFSNPSRQYCNEERLPFEKDNVLLCYFNLPTLPEDAQIDYAQLIYWYTTAPTEGPGQIVLRLYSIDEEWLPDSANGDSFDVNNLGKIYDDGFIILSENDLINNPGGTCQFMITELVNEWYDGKSNYGFGIQRYEKRCSTEEVAYFICEGYYFPNVIIIYR
ncbi:MAG: DNRLRE domain-containing protein [Clostridiales bacterium]|nr:DNRLRE domain-containing protein [Clostridiales bacterium]